MIQNNISVNFLDGVLRWANIIGVVKYLGSNNGVGVNVIAIAPKKNVSHNNPRLLFNSIPTITTAKP